MAEGFRIPDNLYDTVPDAPWIKGRKSTPVGEVPAVSAQLDFTDICGSWKARWGINRMNYIVSPGLYALGDPDGNSPVLVSANYKMSFDRLRQAMPGTNAWILVLDTKGINVWCAAGKGTFGTDELVRRIARTGLERVINHRILIVPQLGATGVAGQEVRKRTGFKVIFGPVRAEDLPAFLQNKYKATPDMRKVQFGLMDRLVLTPIELRAVFTKKWVWAVILLLAVIRLSGLIPIRWADVSPYLGAILVGTVAVPVLLPWIPGRAFAAKGFLLGLLWAMLTIGWQGTFRTANGLLFSLAQVLIIPAISAYLALQFTGASTYTSFSGVVKETRASVPIIKASAALGLIALAVGLFR